MVTRRKREMLRALPDGERKVLEQISRSGSEPASRVAQAKGLLAVADGKTYREAAAAANRKTGATVARWVSEFNQHGLAARERKHGAGLANRPTILAKLRQQSTCDQDGTDT